MGFLHTGATFAADLNLLIQVAMGVALLAGMRLAKLRRFRAHARCQTAVMLLNLVMIGLVMAPSFQQQVSPNLGKTTHDMYYAFPAVHATLGSIAELLGLYVVVVATGLRIVPARWRFHNYRAWMRATLFLWWIVIALGLGTYVVWYMTEGAAAPTSTTTTAALPQAAPAKPEAPLVATVTVQNFTFEPSELKIKVGTTVTWTDTGGRHTVESADGFLKSDTLIAGQTYQKTFDKPGTYEYFCGNHGNKNGTGMVGRVIVSPR